jgi:endogenous inhibitor of DNA gyrase (YacG/DUF329 family)
MTVRRRPVVTSSSTLRKSSTSTSQRNDVDVVTKCAQCRRPIDWNGFGRTPEYCSGRCRQQAYRERKLREQLNRERAWRDACIDCPTCASHVHPSRLTTAGRALCKKLGLIEKHS